MSNERGTSSMPSEKELVAEIKREIEHDGG